MLVDAAGTPVRVRVPPMFERELRTQLADLERPAGEIDPDRTLTLRSEPAGTLALVDGSPVDGASVVRTRIAPAVAIATVVWRLNTIAAASTRHLAVHAGVVGRGGAVLLPGRSGAGKTTLTAACITAGMHYLSDELALVDLGCGKVLPYPKPLGLADERLVPASTVCADALGPALLPAAIVFPRFVDGESTRLTRLDPRWTLSALAGHSPNLAGLGAGALPILAALADTVPAWQTTYGSTAAGVAAVAEAADQPAVTLAPIAPLPRVTPTTTTVPVGDGVAVYDEPGGTLHVLDASAATVWLATTDAQDETEVVEMVRAAAPAASAADISDTLAHLLRCGLLPDGLVSPARRD